MEFTLWADMRDRARVLYLSPSGELGGAELSLLDVLASLPETLPGVERHLVVPETGPLSTRASALGVTVHYLPFPVSIATMGDSAIGLSGNLRSTVTMVRYGLPAAAASMQYGRRLGSFVERLRPAVIHSNGMKMHLLGYLSGIGSAAPLIWHVRDFVSTRVLMAKALRRSARSARMAIAISEAIGRDFRDTIKSLPVEVIANAIDVDHFSPGFADGSILDQIAGFPALKAATLRVGLIATYARWKGQELFLQAAAKVRELRPDLPLRYYIVGGPIYKTAGSQYSANELWEQIDRLGLKQCCALIPFQDDTRSVYRALDVIVHASTRPEPFGRTIVEAMACQRPVIVARDGGASELFTEDYDAVGFVPNDCHQLACAIIGLVDSRARRDRIAAAARHTAVSRYSRQRLATQISTVYRRLLSAGEMALPELTGTNP